MAQVAPTATMMRLRMLDGDPRGGEIDPAQRDAGDVMGQRPEVVSAPLSVVGSIHSANESLDRWPRSRSHLAHRGPCYPKTLSSAPSWDLSVLRSDRYASAGSRR